MNSEEDANAILETNKVLPTIRKIIGSIGEEAQSIVVCNLMIDYFFDHELDEEDIRNFIKSTLEGHAQINGNSPLKIMFYNEEGKIK